MHSYAPVVCLLNARRAGVQPDIDSPTEKISESLGHLSILPPQHYVGAVQHCHRRSECREDMSKLGRDVPTTDDDHGFRQLRKPHHRIGGMELHRAQPRQIWDNWTTAGCDDNPLRTNRLRRPHLQLARPNEARSAIEDGDIVALLPKGAAVGRFGINSTEDSFLNLTPSDALKIQINPEPGGLSRRGGKIGRIDEHLAGNAANVEAGPTKGAHLD